MGRYLHVNDKKLPLLDGAVEKLIDADVLYECGEDGHDLHLNIRPLLLTENEMLAVAIAEGMVATMLEESAATVARAVHAIQPDGTVLITTNGVTRVIPLEEPVFLLRGQDVAAAEAVRYWAGCAEAEGAKPEILEEAREHAARMDAWTTKKVPDFKAKAFPTGLWDKALSAQAEVKGLPVAGYKPTQSQASIDLVNEGKQIEERALRWAEKVLKVNIDITLAPEASQYIEFGKMDVQKGFMLLYRAVFQPKGSRIALPEDQEIQGRDENYPKPHRD